MIRDYLRMFKITGGGWAYAILILLRCPVDLMFTWTQASFLQLAFNAVGQADRQGLTHACLFFGIATLCVFLYNGTVRVFFSAFGVRMETKLRLGLYEKITSLSCEKIERLPQGEWITRLNTDVQMPFSQPVHLPHAVNSIVNIGVSAAILWMVDPSVFGWVILFVIPHVAVSQLLVARAMPGLNRKSLEATGKNTDELTAFVTCADVAALYDGQEYLLKRFESSSFALLRANMRMRARNALSAAMLPLFGLSGYLVLLLAGCGWIANGHLSFGDLTAAFQYRGGVLLGSMMLIGSLINVQASMAGIRRINETMDEKTENGEGQHG